MPRRKVFEISLFPPSVNSSKLPFMKEPDIRWKQRFENYTKAVEQMTRFIEAGELNEMEEQGLI